MEPIADDEHALPVLGARLKARGANAVVRGHAGLLCNDVSRIDAMLRQVFRTDLSFGIVRVRPIAAGGDDRLCITPLVEIQGVIEPCLEDF